VNNREVGRQRNGSNDAMKSSLMIILNDTIFGTGCPINFMFDSRCLLSAASEPHRLVILICYFYCTHNNITYTASIAVVKSFFRRLVIFVLVVSAAVTDTASQVVEPTYFDDLFHFATVAYVAPPGTYKQLPYSSRPPKPNCVDPAGCLGGEGATWSLSHAYQPSLCGCKQVVRKYSDVADLSQLSYESQQPNLRQLVATYACKLRLCRLASGN